MLFASFLAAGKLGGDVLPRLINDELDPVRVSDDGDPPGSFFDLAAGD